MLLRKKRNNSISRRASKDEDQSKDTHHKRTRFSKRYCSCSLGKVAVGLVIGIIGTIFFMTEFLNPYNEQLNQLFFGSDVINELMMSPYFNSDVLSNLTALLTSFQRDDEESSSFVPGLELAKKGAHAHFPVVLIPGITSTGLELWKGKKCSENYFRRRIWGTLDMLRLLLVDKECWKEHFKLDPLTGTAADYLMPFYWVWGKIIKNLAAIGYDNGNLILASYDWRLSFYELEKRDHYFSKTKSTIELLLKTFKKKVVIIAHSMGVNVWIYFMNWVSHKDPSWIDVHIESFINIAGPLLGVPKTVSALLSGETRETAQLGALESYFLDLLLSKGERRDIWRTLGGLYSMVPSGGNLFWGSKDIVSPDDLEDNESFKYMIRYTDQQRKNITAEEVNELLFSSLSQVENEYINSHYSYGITKKNESFINQEKYWSNVLQSPLPNAPRMKIICMYGVGKPTERGYYYRKTNQFARFWESDVQAEDGGDEGYIIDLSINNGKHTNSGIMHSEGDGTVPLLSSGYMCVHGWKKIKRFNPSNVSLTTIEYLHQPINHVRGGPATADHVDILGNTKMTIDILNIVSNRYAHVNEKIYSNIKDISNKINFD